MCARNAGVFRRRYAAGRSSGWWRWLGSDKGLGAFSYSKSHINRVVEYIKRQEEHHRKKIFIEEYHDFLKKFGIEFDDRFIFKPAQYDEE